MRTMTEYAPAAIQHMFDSLNAVIPQAIMAGIVGDSAHTYGYHRGRNYVGSNDYSVQTPPDKKGNGEAASALDISWETAQWQYTVSQRLMNAKNDSRMNPIREFFGSIDGRNVCGWDYYGNYSVTSDDSHLWHIHISVLREYADNDAALQGVAAVMTGSSGTGGDWFDMATQTDLENAVRKVLNEGTDGVPYKDRFRRMSNRIAALLPGGNADESGAKGPDRLELFKALFNSGSAPRMDPDTGTPTMDSPAVPGNYLAYADDRVTQKMASVLNKLDAQQADLDLIKANLGIE